MPEHEEELTEEELAMLKELNGGDVSVQTEEPSGTTEPEQEPEADATLEEVAEQLELTESEAAPEPEAESEPEKTAEPTEIELLRQDVKAANDGKAALGREIAQHRRDARETRAVVAQMAQAMKAAEAARAAQTFEFDESGTRMVPSPPATPQNGQQPAPVSDVDRSINGVLARVEAAATPENQQNVALADGYDSAKAFLVQQEPERAFAFFEVEQAFGGMMRDLDSEARSRGIAVNSIDGAVAMAKESGLSETWETLNPGVPWEKLLRLHSTRNNPRVLRDFIDDVRAKSDPEVDPEADPEAEKQANADAVKTLTNAPKTLAKAGRGGKPESTTSIAQSLLDKVSKNPELLHDLVQKNPRLLEEIEKQLVQA